jgi:hypothetical protein
MKNFKIVICLIVIIFTASLLGANVYGGNSDLENDKRDLCSALSKQDENIEKQNRPKIAGLRTFEMLSYCDLATQAHVARYGDTTTKRVSERYGTDIETNYSLKSYCGSVYAFVHSLSNLDKIVSAYIVAESIASPSGKKVDLAFLAPIYGDLAVIDTKTFMGIDTELSRYKMKGTKAYNELFKALYSANPDKALDIVEIYSKQKNVREVLASIEKECGY